ncbi:MAG: ATP-binding protein [Planctomycetota bacterium]
MSNLRIHRDVSGSGSFLRSVLDAVPSHVAVLDERGVVVDVNDSWRSFGERNEGDPEILGPGVNYLSVCDRAASNDAVGAADVARGIREVIGGVRDDYHMCYPCHSPDQHRWFQVRVKRCKDMDPVRVVVAHETITETQEIERLSRRHQAELAHVMRLGTMNEMATGLAHELNQPLATISNFASGCLRRLESANGDPEALKEAMGTIVSEAQRAGEILRRVRRFVSKESDLSLPVVLGEVVEDAIALARGEAREAGVSIEKDFAVGRPTTTGDPVQIQQVVINLLRNAVEAIRDAPGALKEKRIVLRTAFDLPSMARVDVIDTGPGVDRRVIPTLFDPFFSTKVGNAPESNDGSGGMGLGLSLCRSIIESHGGEIRADTNRYGGLTFTFTLPLRKDDSDDG